MRRAAALAALVVALPLTSAAADRFATLPDHRRIHLDCTGKGAVTAILESGHAGDSGAWYKVQPLLAKSMRVCSYDRAGALLSDAGPLPRDGAAIAADLDNALKAAGIRGPFVGVGHSAGALYIRLFAARRPGEVRGLVLVDPSAEHQVRRTEAIYGPGAGSVEGIRRQALACQRFVEKPQLDAADPLYKSCIPKDPIKARAWRKPSTWAAQVSEIETLFTNTSDQVVAAQPKIRRVPAIILTATPPDSAADPGALLQRRFHAELKGQFADAEQRLIPSGHLMMFDDPAAIVTAANDLARR